MTLTREITCSATSSPAIDLGADGRVSRQGDKRGIGHSAIFVGLCTRYSYSTDEHSFFDDRHTAFQGTYSLGGQDTQAKAALRYGIFKHLCWPLEIHSSLGFSLGDRNAPILGMIHTMNEHDLRRTVHDGKDHLPSVLVCFSLCRFG